MAHLELKNLRKEFTPKVVPVKDISLTVDKGEFLTLLGPSGCGKSTILRLIAGLEQPTRGQILLEGQDVSRLGPGDRNIAMVFQSYALYPHLTVYENIISALKLRKTPKDEIRQRVAEVADFLGLHDLMDRKPGQLSGGQRQRVAVARTLVRRPGVFLLDEPLSNLDALLREHVRAELKQLFNHQESPVVYVTHDQTEAMTLSSKVAVLSNGCLQQLDTPQHIYTRPANQFVAGFVGSPQMNFLTVPYRNGSAVLGDARFSLPSSRSMPDRLILGIRPEHISLAHPEDEQTVRGRVFLVENLGMHSLVSVQVPGAGGGESTTTLRALVPVNQNVTAGDTLDLALPSEAIHWFDEQSGDRLEFSREVTVPAASV